MRMWRYPRQPGSSPSAKLSLSSARIGNPKIVPQPMNGRAPRGVVWGASAGPWRFCGTSGHSFVVLADFGVMLLVERIPCRDVLRMCWYTLCGQMSGGTGRMLSWRVHPSNLGTPFRSQETISGNTCIMNFIKLSSSMILDIMSALPASLYMSILGI